jgi:hypothetical protein
MGRRDAMNAANLVIASALLCRAAAADAASIEAMEAADHVGQTATVCGIVASAKFATSLRSQPTFLNLDKPYPDQVFTAVIFGDDRAKFGTPERSLRGKRICVTGVIRRYREQLEMVLDNPDQLSK